MARMRKPEHYVVTREPGKVEVSGSEIKKHRTPSSVAAVAIVLAVAVVVTLVVGIWVSSHDEEEALEVQTTYVSSYAWENLSTGEDGRLYYTDAEGNSASLVGIDVSEWDTGTDWAAVAADGIDFVIIRIGYRGSGEGGLYEDALFEEAYAGATANGLLVGIYFYSQATTIVEAREEAEFVLEILDGREVDLFIAYDHEGFDDADSRTYGLTDAIYSACAQAFCNRVEHAGYTSAIYGNRYAIAKLTDTVRENYNIWLAEWDTDQASAQFDFCVWQYSSTGSVDGMWRQVDMSIWFTNEVPLITPETRAAALAEENGNSDDFLYVTDTPVKETAEDDKSEDE